MPTRCTPSSFHPALLIAAALTAMLPLVLASAALAQPSANPHVYPTTDTLFGKSYTQWSEHWWQWALALPVDGHPFTEPGFACNSADNGQSGPVWFLGLSPMPPLVTRRCTIPADTAVLLGLANVECSSLEPTFPEGTGGQTEDEQRACASFYANHIVVRSLFCMIDGKAVENLRYFRFPSSQFTFSAPMPWIYGDTGGTGTAVSDGYSVMLKPLSRGTHTVRCGGTFHFSVAEGDPFDGDFGFGNIYSLTVEE
jgi:hypothetical protein